MLRSAINKNFSTAIKKTEVLIVGGGAAGGSLACLLSQSPYFKRSSPSADPNIILIDSSKLPQLSNYKEAEDVFVP